MTLWARTALCARPPQRRRLRRLGVCLSAEAANRRIFFEGEVRISSEASLATARPVLPDLRRAIAAPNPSLETRPWIGRERGPRFLVDEARKLGLREVAFEQRESHTEAGRRWSYDSV